MRERFVRYPCVAGQFYPGEKSALIKLLDKLIPKSLSRERVLGVVSPHAGYIYSGEVAGEVFSRIIIPEKVVLLGPNHTGMGKTFSLMPEGKWVTPLGEVGIDAEIAEKIFKNSQYIEEDQLAHRYEHSLEVQIPFLQYLKEKFSIVPVVISESSYETYEKMGKELAEILKPWRENLLVVASSDMTHYEPHNQAERKDRLAIEAILSLREDLLFERVNRYRISMCGYAPTIIMLSLVKALGAKTAELIRYETSGKASGDYSSVVGYAGIVVK
ncbi:MAG: AmmeMemoRadiSam system protein B [Candidatus Omnitrophica bacterium]|nr:AmmeMemoRadiSam system protein B [Candidatus Omnitrophota bacterium]MCM8798811.1 AmmeMemoRadiSam system protein B [Candidatus Omnitrophota bacterium]